VVGLQAASILFSILDHMKIAADADRCALQTFKAHTVSGLFEELFNHFWDVTRITWHASTPFCTSFSEECRPG